MQYSCGGLGRGPTASADPWAPQGAAPVPTHGFWGGGCGEEGPPWPGASAAEPGAVTPRLQGIL